MVWLLMTSQKTFHQLLPSVSSREPRSLWFCDLMASTLLSTSGPLHVLLPFIGTPSPHSIFFLSFLKIYLLF